MVKGVTHMPEIQKVSIIRTKHLIAHDTIVEYTGDSEFISFEEWKEFGLKLRTTEKGIQLHFQWYLGWWYNNIPTKDKYHKDWNKDAKEFIKKLGYKPETLKVYGSIYNSFTSLTRVNDLPFKHHQLVAPEKYTESQQKKWLQKALKGSKNKKGEYKKWTVNIFKEELKKPEQEKERKKRLKELEESGVEIEQGDALELSDEKIKNNTIDAIITDPPYAIEFINCWTKLSEIAARVLKPGGFCIAYSGSLNLPEVIKRMSEYLTYYWMFILLHTGKHQGIQPRNIENGYKPILIFQKPPFTKLSKYHIDIIEGSGRDKSAHEWQQSEDELIPIIKTFTKKKEIVLDPFCGSGTVLSATIKLKRKAIGFDLKGDK